MMRPTVAARLAPCVGAVVLAACGTTSPSSSSTTATQRLASVLGATHLTVLADPGALPALESAVRAVRRDDPALSVSIQTVPLAQIASSLVTTHDEMVVASLAPAASIVAQSGLAPWPYAPEELTVSVNLGATTGLVLSEAALADLVTGRISVWDDATIAHLNPSLSLPPVPVTIAPIEAGSTVAIWLQQTLGVTASQIRARVSTTCAGTVGCLAFLENSTSPEAASILDATQTARTPTESAYPLSSAATAFIAPAPSAPRLELAATALARALVLDGPEPPAQRAQELTRLDARIASLEASIP
ncbi:hypothetical protein Afer_0458 [Acidimicrobium ferrooxidans DSM 10331]|uniref:PBP domain-containing protein n=1 Tax=Acidimicrobium ferrooxidans (strain DSM 10331 / JCM 15462 / NBRC 103882 / ICP) TaxID=525909 RepID=C7M332_ACIFD|nr:hypothetical protein [Acidimicrobium ferrooxidans]ACU53426.1 hypothetical protein Afer_0458 [Acidimicrobium ferrooxidans DSM 10331]